MFDDGGREGPIGLGEVRLKPDTTRSVRRTLERHGSVNATSDPG